MRPAGETCPLAATLASGEPQRVLHVHHTSSGAQHVDVELSPFSDANGDVTYFIERMKLIPHTSSEASPDKLVGQSAPFRRMLLMASRVARSHAAVLLLGESGTGKEELAKSIHDASQRHHKPFVPVDCSSLTESLLESELFGHEKGAFTGATQRKQGLVEAAQAVARCSSMRWAIFHWPSR
ncbi:sigma 54-interacting transcriptional regulator [Paludibacterium denitrificans]|uniref:sigma 54-interacting transcriptional regulator n=1 Tax=Paludibacterium denitrificans TaxID=2675226 RepID=UPI001E4E54A2|nr:sigma 54-interacting transcriptional regulator [Paludibacterium denitrificans]